MSNKPRSNGRVTPKGTRPPAKTGPKRPAAAPNRAVGRVAADSPPTSPDVAVGAADAAEDRTSEFWMLAGVPWAGVTVAALVLGGLSGLVLGVAALLIGVAGGVSVAANSGPFSSSPKLPLATIAAFTAAVVVGDVAGVDVDWPWAVVPFGLLGAAFTVTAYRQLRPLEAPSEETQAVVAAAGGRPVEVGAATGAAWVFPNGAVVLVAEVDNDGPVTKADIAEHQAVTRARMFAQRLAAGPDGGLNTSVLAVFNGDQVENFKVATGVWAATGAGVAEAYAAMPAAV